MRPQGAVPSEQAVALPVVRTYMWALGLWRVAAGFFGVGLRGAA